MVIITAGMIGVGKTTLTDIIAKKFDTKAFFEPVEEGENPVLSLYYSNPKQYAFLLQIFFLNRRFEMIKQALKKDNNVLDRSIYEDEFFTKQNHLQGNITDLEMDVYSGLLVNMMKEIHKVKKGRPDLLVYAKADLPTILYRIKKRGREYEQYDNKPELKEYFETMWKSYSKWYEDYDQSPKMEIDLGKYDLDDPKNHKIVLEMIEEKLKVLPK